MWNIGLETVGEWNSEMQPTTFLVVLYRFNLLHTYHHQEQIGCVVTSRVTPYSACLFLHPFLSPQTSLSCWMVSLFNVTLGHECLVAFWISRLSLAAQVFSLMVSVLRSALFWLGLLDLVALDGFTFVSSYNLAFEITCGYTIEYSNSIS